MELARRQRGGGRRRGEGRRRKRKRKRQCKTNKMIADALTKNLPTPAFEQHLATMMREDEAPFSAMLFRV